MLHIIIGTDSTKRIKDRAVFLAGKEAIVLDDTTSSIGALEQYAYPSLFSVSVPLVHAKYLLEASGSEVSDTLVSILVASPTVFILEEKTVPAPLVKILEKGGALMHKDMTSRAKTQSSTIFAVTTSLTASSKKERWMSYRAALKEHAPEAIIGILYWKLRQLIDSSTSKNAPYKELYEALIRAHKTAWQRGTPLEVAIEKVILE